MAMATESYTVRLDVFQGPLDLLLHLIKRAELDISVISIASITDQFMSYLTDIDYVDVETAGEFLLIASTLLEIKSRTVMPVEGASARDLTGVDTGEDDAAMELLGQLLEYKRFRDAADSLEGRKDEWAQRYPAAHARFDKDALREAQDDEPSVDLEDIELFDLVQAFQRIMDTIVFDRLGDHEVMYDDTPIELHQADIVDRLGRLDDSTGGRLRFRQIFEGRNKGEVIGLFLAILELAKQRRVAFEIVESGEDVHLWLQPPGAEDDIENTSASAWEDDHIFGDDDELEDDED
jgi:segregation and condensation protein A